MVYHAVYSFIPSSPSSSGPHPPVKRVKSNDSVVSPTLHYPEPTASGLVGAHERSLIGTQPGTGQMVQLAAPDNNHLHTQKLASDLYVKVSGAGDVACATQATMAVHRHSASNGVAMHSVPADVSGRASASAIHDSLQLALVPSANGQTLLLLHQQE